MAMRVSGIGIGERVMVMMIFMTTSTYCAVLRAGRGGKDFTCAIEIHHYSTLGGTYCVPVLQVKKGPEKRIRLLRAVVEMVDPGPDPRFV